MRLSSDSPHNAARHGRESGVLVSVRSRPGRCALKIVSCLAFLCGAAPVWGQSSFPFQISLTEGNNTSNIVNGATVSLASSGPGQTAAATLTVTYLGTSSAVFNTAPQVLGAQNFTVVTTATFPLTLQPMGQLSFTINYVAFAPIGTSPITAQLDLGYVETGTPSTSGLMALDLSGTTPNLSVSYTASATGNVTSLISGSTLLFPNTVINTTSTIPITISNQGNGTGTVSAISLTGAGFQALGLPQLPLNVPAGSSVQFSVEFAPTQAGSDTGALQMTLGGAMFTANLQGTATASSFSYQVGQGTSSQAVTPGQTITVPDTNVGSQNSVQVVVTNTGTASGIINSILVSGTGFSLTDGPPLPLTLLPNGSATITVTFMPTTPGSATGHLRFNNDTFNLASNGIGPQLIYSYTVANSASVTVIPNGGLVFSQTSVGQSSSATVTVQNTGNAPATVISVGTAVPAGSTQSPLVFTVANVVPTLPASLAAGQSLTFTVVFSPNNTGLESSNLLIDTAAFTLTGLGGPPVPLPAYSFSGPQGVQAPFQQPAVGLSLASPYSLPLTGTLVLTQNSGTLSPDPAVQFSTGGQTVAFTIAANSTNAVFSNGSNQIGLQTGSVATTVTITPSFSTQAGLNLTPSSPQTLDFSVAAAAPQLLTAGVSSLASNSFTLTITGYTTTRSLASLQFQIAANSSVNLSSSTTVLDVSGASQGWFQSSASQAFGGQFVLAIPFNIQVSSGTLSSPANALESISVTASNGSGVSNSLTATIP
jgi:hypothetical protein